MNIYKYIYIYIYIYIYVPLLVTPSASDEESWGDISGEHSKLQPVPLFPCSKTENQLTCDVSPAAVNCPVGEFRFAVPTGGKRDGDYPEAAPADEESAHASIRDFGSIDSVALHEIATTAKDPVDDPARDLNSVDEGEEPLFDFDMQVSIPAFGLVPSLLASGVEPVSASCLASVIEDVAGVVGVPSVVPRIAYAAQPMDDSDKIFDVLMRELDATTTVPTRCTASSLEDPQVSVLSSPDAPPCEEQIRARLEDEGWEATNRKNLNTFYEEYLRAGHAKGAYTIEDFQQLARELAGYRMLKPATTSRIENAR